MIFNKENYGEVFNLFSIVSRDVKVTACSSNATADQDFMQPSGED